MNSNFSTMGPEELEVQITALLVGELAGDDAAELERFLAQDPALIRLRTRLARTLDLVCATVNQPSSASVVPLRLPEERRSKLLFHFKHSSPTEEVGTAKPASRRMWILSMAAAAGLMALAGVLFWEGGSDHPLLLTLRSSLSDQGELASVGQEHNDFSFGDFRTRWSRTNGLVSKDESKLSSPLSPEPRSLLSYAAEPLVRQKMKPTAVSSTVAPVTEADLGFERSLDQLTENRSSEGLLSGGQAAATRFDRAPRFAGLSAGGSLIVLERAPTHGELPKLDVKALKDSVDKRVIQNSEPLAKAEAGEPIPTPQPEVSSDQNRLSTFSLNVTDVSFKLAAASLQNNALPEAGSIRTEEFINAFHYRDPEPVPGVPVAFRSERARYPFAHDRDILRLSVKTAAQGREAGRPLNLVLLLDNSGSMERADRVDIVRGMLQQLALQLQPQDRISVITFARTAQLRVDGMLANSATGWITALGDPTPEGGTNLEEALRLGYATCARHFLSGGVNRVVLLTDGAANLGEVNAESLTKAVSAARLRGMALDCFGVGWEGFNDEMLATLSRHGDGRYGFVNSVEEAGTEFAGRLAGALKAAASDVKVQVEFNPKRTRVWRQLGYAQHQLTAQQFRDNTVDAAELGAAEAGQALYVLQVDEAGSGPIGTARVRYRLPDSNRYFEHEWEIPYERNTPALERGPANLRLAASAGAFAEWLSRSPFAEQVNMDRLLAVLGDVPSQFHPDPRPKQLQEMLQQARTLAGQTGR